MDCGKIDRGDTLNHLIYGDGDGQQAASEAFIVNAGKAKTVWNTMDKGKGPTNVVNKGSFFRWRPP